MKVLFKKKVAHEGFPNDLKLVFRFYFLKKETIKLLDSTKVVDYNDSILAAILQFSILLFPLDQKQNSDFDKFL